MDSKRKRRRETCDTCGKSLSSSWYREHKTSCVMKKQKTNQPTMKESDCGDLAKTICEDRTSLVDDWAAENISTDSETVQSSPWMQEQELTETHLPNEIAASFSELLEEKLLESEDVEFFEEQLLKDENEPSNDKQLNINKKPETEASTTFPLATETWDDPDDDKEVEQDFEVNGNTTGSYANGEMHADASRLEVLVLWLMLFLSSWQSSHSITDTALAILIKFLCRFFWLIGAFDNTMATISKLFPNSHYKLKKALGMLGDDFTKFVVCPKCKALYKFEDCIEVRSGRQVSAKCSFVAWPHHPHRNKRGPCGEFLLKPVRTGRRTFLYPRMVFPYNSVVKALQAMLNRPAFWKKCQQWRSAPARENFRADIYDGNLWKELTTSGFLANINSLALMLNVDWFKPHKHSPGSIGVLYLVVLNLPRSERYKIENVIVLGILPGPSEPRLAANTFLRPLVDELKLLWKASIRFSVYGGLFKRAIKVGLICVACDIPAARKIGGFLGHMANQGCSFCKKEFFKNGRLDFSEFDREHWTARKSEEHKKLARETLNETTPTAQQSKSSEHGARYSVLHELEYFDCIRYFVVDPMHNLYLGTAKHMMKSVWQNEQSPLLKDEHFKEIQAKVDSMVTPQDIGRVPGKIADSFNGFTADQWQSWTIVYSMYALQGVLPKEHLDCWQIFVSACQLLGRKIITDEEIERGDQYLLKFLQEAVRLYGSEVATPNMHLHCHLKSFLYDFGPMHGFWCFGFERFNGVLGSYHTNNRSIEIQIMRKFLAEIKTKSFELPELFKEDFKEFFIDQDREGSLKSTSDPVEALLALRLPRTVPIFEVTSVNWCDASFVQAMPPVKDNTLDKDDVRYLKQVYAKLLELEDTEMLDIPFTIAKFSSVKLGNVVYGSCESRTLRNCYVVADWAGTNGRLDDSNSKETRPGEVDYFFRHRVQVRSVNSSSPAKTYQLHFARVNWYSKHPDQHAYGNSVQIWCNDFDSFGPACFVPVQRIYARVAVTKGQHKRETVTVVTTLPGY